MPNKANAPWYPNFPNPEDGLRYVINALQDQKDAISALNLKHASTETRITNVVQEQSTVVGKLPISIAAQVGYFLDSYDANTGLFTASLAASSLNFSDDEVPGGSGFAWTLAHTPNPVGSIQLYSIVAGYGGVLLDRNSVGAEGYTVSGTNITTVTSYSAGALRCWYRY